MLDGRRITKAYLKEITIAVTGAAIEVHKHLGPGLLESIYQECMMHELTLRGIKYESEKMLSINYKNLSLKGKYKCDLYVENCLVLEYKTVSEILPIHQAQILTYMRILNAPKGIIINFNGHKIFPSGQKTLVNNLFWQLPDR